MTRKNKLIPKEPSPLHKANVAEAIVNQSAKIITLERRIEQLEGIVVPISHIENPNIIKPNMTLGRDEIVVEQPPMWHHCGVCLKQFDSTKGSGTVTNTLVELPYRQEAISKEGMRAYVSCSMHCTELVNASITANRGEVHVKATPLNRVAYPPEMKSGAVKAIIKLQDEANKLKQKDVPQLQVKNPEVVA